MDTADECGPSLDCMRLFFLSNWDICARRKNLKSHRYLRIANGKAAVCCLPERDNSICQKKKKKKRKSCHHQLTMADMVRDISTGLVLL